MKTPRVIEIDEPRVGLRGVIVIDSLARGPAFGGVRRAAYADEAAALEDARRLAEAMSQKCALAELPAGGAKTVILDSPQLRREAAYERLGEIVEGLGGQYVCGPDIGTGEVELAAIRRATRWVNPVQNDAARSTAAGVLAGLRGLSRAVFGDEQLGDRRYVIQGLGAVGSALAAALIGAGARVSGWDPDPRARARAAEMDVILLDEGSVMSEPCEVFMPCAIGGILSTQRCEQGPWRAICGAANNQLGDLQVATLLHRRGVAWAPDFAVNAGAVIEGVETVLGPGARERVVAGIEAIGDRVEMILARARDEDRSSLDVALELAQARL
ncbi:MAG: Glu/Leu/Phe/Val dehydrogenase dimerization domain-containing protein [Enhygromyxa sp.]